MDFLILVSFALLLGAFIPTAQGLSKPRSPSHFGCGLILYSASFFTLAYRAYWLIHKAKESGVPISGMSELQGSYRLALLVGSIFLVAALFSKQLLKDRSGIPSRLDI